MTPFPYFRITYFFRKNNSPLWLTKKIFPLFQLFPVRKAVKKDCGHCQISLERGPRHVAAAPLPPGASPAAFFPVPAPHNRRSPKKKLRMFPSSCIAEDGAGIFPRPCADLSCGVPVPLCSAALPGMHQKKAYHAFPAASAQVSRCTFPYHAPACSGGRMQTLRTGRSHRAKRSDTIGLPRNGRISRAIPRTPLFPALPFRTGGRNSLSPPLPAARKEPCPKKSPNLPHFR